MELKLRENEEMQGSLNENPANNIKDQNLNTHDWNRILEHKQTSAPIGSNIEDARRIARELLEKRFRDQEQQKPPATRSNEGGGVVYFNPSGPRPAPVEQTIPEEKKEEITSPIPTTLSGEPEKIEDQTFPELENTEEKEVKSEPFDADKILPTTPTVEDVSDILNQSQEQHIEEELKLAETLESGDGPKKVQYFRPSGPRPTAFSPIILPNELKARVEQKTEQPKPFDADEIVPIEPTVEDISDILNQSQGQPAEAEQKPATTSPENSEALLEDQKEIQKEGKELKELEELRTLLVQAENRKENSSSGMVSMNLDIENLRAEYEEKKEAVARMLREKLTGVAGGPLNKEQQKLFDDTVFEEIIKKESDAYLNSLREARKNNGGAMVKIQEGMKSFLGLSAIQWYRKQDKYKRIGAIALLAGVGIGGGMFLGGAAASTALASGAGAIIYRGARGLASAGVMTGVGKMGKKSIEKIDEKEMQDIENIRDSEKSLAEKAADFLKIREEAEKQRRKVMIMTGAASVAGGVGAGVGAGAAMDMFADYYGIGESSSAPLESKGKPGAPKVPTQEELNSINEKIYEEHAPKLDSKDFSLGSEELKHVPEKGDSNWRLLEKTLEHDDRFSGLERSGQKSFALAMFNNKVLGDPAQYGGGGVGADGSVTIGKPVDYSKLFEDKKWVDEVLEKAKNLPENRIKIIEDNDAKISTWVKDPAHQGQNLDSKTVEEILNTKPEKEPLVIRPENHYKNISSDDLNNEDSLNPGGESTTELESVPSENLGNTEKGAENQGDNKMQEAVDSILQKPKMGEEGFEGKTMLAGGGIVAASALSRNPGGFGVIEGGRKDGVDQVRSLQGDSKRAIAEILSTEKVEEHFRNDINAIYGKKGVLGIGKQEGIDTAEWKEVAPLDASKVIAYYNNPENSDLPPRILESLKVSQKHRQLMNYINFLMNEAREATKFKSGDEGANVVPLKAQAENMANYLKRLGKFVAEHPRPSANEVPKGQVMEAALFKKAA